MTLAGSVGCIRGRALAKTRVHVPEKLVLRSVLQFLQLHPLIAWVQRMNTGATKIDTRFVRYGFAGLSDIIGQVTDGRFLAIECKSSTGRLTPSQVAFLRLVKDNGGISGVVRSIDDVETLLRSRQ